MTATLNRHTSGPLVKAMRERNSTLTEPDAKLAVARVFDAIETLVSTGTPVRISGFGTFKRTYRASHTVKNPRTGEMVTTADKNVITFKMGKGAL